LGRPIRGGPFISRDKSVRVRWLRLSSAANQPGDGNGMYLATTHSGG